MVDGHRGRAPLWLCYAEWYAQQEDDFHHFGVHSDCAKKLVLFGPQPQEVQYAPQRLMPPTNANSSSCSRKLATPSDRKHRSAPNTHGHEVECSTRRTFNLRDRSHGKRLRSPL